MEKGEVAQPQDNRKGRFSLVKKIAAWIMILGAIGVAVFSYVKLRAAERRAEEVVITSDDGQSVTAVKNEVAKREITGVEEMLGKLVMLPEGETPTLSTITNKDEITENKDFFKDAENGDKVLVYPEAKMAFLYRPSTNKLINLAPVNLEQTGGINPSPTPEKVVDPENYVGTVALYNGTGEGGLTRLVEPLVTDVFPGVEIVARAVTESDYSESRVVAINREKDSLAAAIAEELGAGVGNMPRGEIRPEADILIIVGEDLITPSPSTSPASPGGEPPSP